MKITALLFAYNQERYIEEALNSVLNQNIHPSQYELVVSDDCSSDDTFKIIQKIMSAYEGPFHVKINRNSANLGLIGHVNYVFNKFVKSEYVFFQAGDDMSLPNRASVILNYLEHNPHIKLIVSDAMKVHFDGRKFGTFINPANYHKYYRSTEELISKGNMHYGAGIGMQSEVFHRFGDLDTYLGSEDDAFALRASILGKLGLIKEVLLKYRIHNANLTNWHKRKESLEERKLYYIQMLERKIAHLKHLEKISSSVYGNPNFIKKLKDEIQYCLLKQELINCKSRFSRLKKSFQNLEYLKLKSIPLVLSPRIFFRILSKL